MRLGKDIWADLEEAMLMLAGYIRAADVSGIKAAAQVVSHLADELREAAGVNDEYGTRPPCPSCSGDGHREGLVEQLSDDRGTVWTWEYEECRDCGGTGLADYPPECCQGCGFPFPDADAPRSGLCIACAGDV